MKYRFLVLFTVFSAFSLCAQYQKTEVTISGQFGAVVSESGFFADGKNYTLSFVIDKEISRSFRDSQMVFSEAIKDLTFSYDNGTYVGTISKADLVISNYSGASSTNVLTFENMRGIDMPSIEGMPLIMKSPLYVELAADTSGLASGELSDLDLSATYVTMKAVIMSWGFQGRDMPPEWLYDEAGSISTTVIPVSE